MGINENRSNNRAPPSRYVPPHMRDGPGDNGGASTGWSDWNNSGGNDRPRNG